MKSLIRMGLLTRLFQNLKLLFPLIRDFWNGRYRNVSFTAIAVFVLGIVYIFSPIDIIPDYLIGLGQIDDAAVLALSLYFLEKDLIKYKEWRDKNGNKNNNGGA